jgi:hypothetical protein
MLIYINVRYPDQPRFRRRGDDGRQAQDDLRRAYKARFFVANGNSTFISAAPQVVV